MRSVLHTSIACLVLLFTYEALKLNVVSHEAELLTQQADQTVQLRPTEDNATFAFRIQNPGKHPVHITQMQGSCSCLKIQGEKQRVIKGGEEIRLEVTFSMLEYGRSTQHVILKYGPDKTVLLTLHVERYARIAAEPGFVLGPITKISGQTIKVLGPPGVQIAKVDFYLNGVEVPRPNADRGELSLSDLSLETLPSPALLRARCVLSTGETDEVAVPIYVTQ